MNEDKKNDKPSKKPMIKDLDKTDKSKSEPKSKYLGKTDGPAKKPMSEDTDKTNEPAKKPSMKNHSSKGTLSQNSINSSLTRLTLMFSLSKAFILSIMLILVDTRRSGSAYLKPLRSLSLTCTLFETKFQGVF